MEKFKTYIASVDGKNGWDVIKPLFDDAFHPDLVVVTADGEMNKEQWAAMAKGLAERGATASGFTVTGADGDAVYYELTITLAADEHMHMTAKATVRDGQLLRVEPMDPAAYSALVERGT